MTPLLTGLPQRGTQGPAQLARAHLSPPPLTVVPRPPSPDLSVCLGKTGQELPGKGSTRCR